MDSTKTIIITGGCSGLGFATAKVLTEQGHRVALLDINPEAAEQALCALPTQQASIIATDVCNPAQVGDAISQVETTWGRIDAVVNCAGIAPAKRMIDKEGQPHPLDLFEKTININLIGSFNVARMVAAQMAKQEQDDGGHRGVIINTASIAGYEGQIGQAAYAASKGGIIGMTLPMARDLASVGIRVNTIAPGIMATPLLLAMPQKVQDALAANVPFPKRLGDPVEFGKLVAHIIDNQYINGETIRLDGALRMAAK